MTQDENAVLERRLNEARVEADAALAGAKEALETAQLQALAVGVPVPGRLSDDVQRWQKRLSDCDGALIAFQRVKSDAAAAGQQQARADREQQVADAVSRVRAAGEALVAAIDQLMNEGAGAELARSIDALRVPLYGVGPNTMTSSGWQISDALRSLYHLPASAMGWKVLRLVALDEHRSRGVLEAKDAIDAFCAGIETHVNLQPDTWPAE